MLALTQSTPPPRPDSAELEARYLLPAYPPLPIEPIAGDGVWLTTADGRRLLDFYGGHAVALLGHGHPRLLAAIEAQARTLLFQTSAVPQAARGRAAEALLALAPPGLDRVFFVSTGAEANENALRLALRRSGRAKVVAIEGAFHGRTAAAAAVTWGAERWYGFPARPFEVEFVPRDPSALERAVDERTAAVILEPVQGVAGAVPLGRELLAPARCSSSTRCSAASAGSARPSRRGSMASPPTCSRSARGSPAGCPRRRCWRTARGCRRSPPATSAPPSAADRR